MTPCQRLPSKEDSNTYSTSEQAKIVLSRKIWAGSALIHLFALGTTIAVVQLSFRNVYWYDEGGFPAGLPEDDVLNLLQFVAKIHEILIVASVSSMTIHIVRRRLLGKGIPFGLFTSAYDVSPKLLVSKSLWAAFKNFKDGTFVVVLILVLLFVNAVGPSSAIALIPQLDWWPIDNPDSMKDIYIDLSEDEVYPLDFDKTTDRTSLTECNRPFQRQWCPNGAWEDIAYWASSYSWKSANASPNISMIDPFGLMRRQLISKIGNGTISSTPHSGIVQALELLWRNLNSTMEGIARPMFSLGGSIFSPVVHVQCKTYDYYDDELQWPDGTLVDPALYQDMSPILDGLPNSIEASVSFTWVNLEPSLGAFIKAPRNLDHSQSAYLFPCSLDARWSPAEVWLDPTYNDLVNTNLTDPTLPSSSPIRIDTNWAQLLNLRGFPWRADGFFRDYSNVTMMQSLLLPFVSISDDKRLAEFKVPYPGPAVANVVETIVAMVVTEGLSRHTMNTVTSGLVHATSNGYIWTNLNSASYLRTRKSYKHSLDVTSEGREWTRLGLEIQRFGYGYSLESRTVQFGVVVLCFYISVLATYVVYSSWYWIRGGWRSGAWSQMEEIMALAMRKNLGDVRGGVEKAETWRIVVKVRVTSDEKLELVKNGGVELGVGKKYR